MTYYLRNSKNRTIVDLELYVKKDHHSVSYVELHSSVIINTYSEFLLDNLDKKEEIVEDFEGLSNLRGWLWEVHFATKDNTAESYKEVCDIVDGVFRGFADKYKLYYVTD